MELTFKADAKVRVSAVLEEDGKVSVKVFGSAPYDTEKGGTRTTTAEVIPSNIEKVKDALEEVLKDSLPILSARIQDAVHVSRQASIRLNEF